MCFFCVCRIIGICFDMGIEEGVVELHDDKGKIDQKLTISVHTFSDLTYTSPVVFLYLLKECYAHGKISFLFLCGSYCSIGLV